MVLRGNLIKMDLVHRSYADRNTKMKFTRETKEDQYTQKKIVDHDEQTGGSENSAEGTFE